MVALPVIGLGLRRATTTPGYASHFPAGGLSTHGALEAGVVLALRLKNECASYASGLSRMIVGQW
jgi:hypothetical protein